MKWINAPIPVNPGGVCVANEPADTEGPCQALVVAPCVANDTCAVEACFANEPTCGGKLDPEVCFVENPCLLKTYTPCVVNVCMENICGEDNA